MLKCNTSLKAVDFCFHFSFFGGQLSSKHIFFNVIFINKNKNKKIFIKRFSTCNNKLKSNLKAVVNI